MPLPSSGPIKFSQIRSEFGGTFPIRMSTYITSGVITLSSNGRPSIKSVAGKSAFPAPPFSGSVVQAYMAKTYSGTGAWQSIQGGGSMTRGTTTGFVSTAPQAFSMDGNTKSAFIGKNIPMIEPHTYSVAIAVKRTRESFSFAHRIIGTHNYWDAGMEWCINSSGVLILSQLGWAQVTNVTFPLNTWRHLILCFDRHKTIDNLKVYMNGVLITTMSSTFSTSATFGGLQVGARYDNNNEGWIGDIGGVIVYNRTITNAEALSIFDYFKSVMGITF